MKLDFFSTFILLFLAVLGFSQTEDGVENEIYCESTNYQFEVEGNLFNPGKRSRVYVCPKNLPVEVLVRRIDNMPITGDISWKINGTVSSFVGNPILLKQSEFDGKKIVLKCDFNDNGLQSMQINVLKNIALKFSEKDKKYQFDDNKIQAYRDLYYPGTLMNVPWNFVENGKFEKLRAKSTKKKGYYAINSIVSNSNQLSIVPASLSSAKADIDLSMQPGEEQHIIEVMGCDSDPELYLFTSKDKMYHIEYWELCDTDDDKQVVLPGTHVTSSYDVCIDAGSDGTIDGRKDTKQGDDKIFFDQVGHQTIVAGPNMICESEIHKPDPIDECPGSYDFESSFNEMNKLYNKVGVYFVNDGYKGVKKMNYQINHEDGVFSKKEQIDFGNKLGASEVIRVYYVKNLGGNSDGTVQGRAVFGSNIIVLADAATDKNLIHEAGHAIWSLEHPGEPYTPGYKGEFQINDYENFMHGISNEVTKWAIRRYQFGKIHP